jgi:hypothetical protein
LGGGAQSSQPGGATITLRPPRRRQVRGTNTVMVLPVGTQLDLGHAAGRPVLSRSGRSSTRVPIPSDARLLGGDYFAPDWLERGKIE